MNNESFDASGQQPESASDTTKPRDENSPVEIGQQQPAEHGPPGGEPQLDCDPSRTPQGESDPSAEPSAPRGPSPPEASIESATPQTGDPALQPEAEGDLPGPGGVSDPADPAGPSVPSEPAPGPLRSKIQIGRKSKPAEPPAAETPREEPSGEMPQKQVEAEPVADQTASEVEPAREAPTAASRQPVPVPSVRDPLPADLEEQLAAVMGDAELDELLSGGTGDTAGGVIEMESRHQSSISRIHGDNVFFSLGGRNEGIASLRQFHEPPQVGMELEVIVKSYLADEGLYELLIPGASSQVDDWSDVVEGAIVEARITGANTGGLECKVGNLRGFIPSSQIAMFRVEDYAEYIDQKLLCVVSEVNPKRKNLVLSRRAILEREKEEARKQLLENLEAGQVVEGVVRKLMDFGAFVDIGGVDGLVHISQLSWDRVNHPSEVIEVGQKIRVKVEKVDVHTGKIGLSYRDLLDHPWHDIQQKFAVDALVKGTVSRIAKFGAFVKLSPGVEGLVHISELSHGRVPSVGAVVSEGQTVDVKVLSVDTEAQRIALSMKAVIPEPESAEPDQGEAEEAVKQQREKLASQRTRPLKGGIGRDSGGEQFGLKW